MVRRWRMDNVAPQPAMMVAAVSTNFRVHWAPLVPEENTYEVIFNIPVQSIHLISINHRADTTSPYRQEVSALFYTAVNRGCRRTDQPLSYKGGALNQCRI